MSRKRLSIVFTVRTWLEPEEVQELLALRATTTRVERLAADPLSDEYYEKLASIFDEDLCIWERFVSAVDAALPDLNVLDLLSAVRDERVE